MSLQNLQLRAKMTHLSRISKYAPDEWKRGIVASALCHPKICYMYDKSAFPRYRSFQPSECFHWPEFSSILHNMTVQWFEWKSKMNGDIRTEECQDRYHSIWAPHFSHNLNFSISEYDFGHWGQTVFHFAWLAFNTKVKVVVVKTLRLLSFVICRKQRDTGCLHQSLAFSCSRRVSPTISTVHRSRTVYFQSILVTSHPSHIFINFPHHIISWF